MTPSDPSTLGPAVSPPAAPGRERRLGWRPRDLAPLATMTVLVIFFSFASEDFFKLGTVSQVLKQGAVLAIVSVGLTFVLIAAEIDLAVGALATWTACLCAWLFAVQFNGGASPKEVSGVMVWASMTLPLLCAVFLGMASGALTTWSRLPSFIITLAMMNIAKGLAQYRTKSQTFPVPDVLMTIGQDGLEIDAGADSVGLMIPYSALLAGVVLAVGHLVLTYTRFGRYVFMTGGNREAARLAGVRVGTIVIACLAISALTAGLGGLVNAGRLSSASVLANEDLLLSAVACVVLGGTSLFGGEGSIPRTIVGVTTFTVLRVGLQQIRWIEEDARGLLMGLVLLGALVLNGWLAKRD